jgi:adenylate cyclase
MKADARDKTPTDRLAAAIREETVASLKRAATARAVLAVLLLGIVGAMWREWFAVGWWAAIALLFATFGAAQWRLAASRHHRMWHAFPFATLDAALIAFLLLWPNPFGPPMAFEIQMLTRSYTFVFFTVLLAMSALSFSWAVVLYTGVVSALIWAGSVVGIALTHESITDWGIAYSWWNPDSRERFLDPRFVSIRGMIQEGAVLILSAAVLAVAVWRANVLMRRHARSERDRAALARYFSPGIVDEIAALDRPLGAVRSQHAAVLFADIVGFTRLSEGLGPERTMALLREFHARTAAAVFAHEGTVDKYIGDAIMATFGAPRASPADAANAIRCALAMIDTVAAWNTERVAAGDATLAIGIGVHYGPVVAGDLGDERRLEYAVIGDTVNTASRIEALTRERAVPALISAVTLAAARDRLDDAALARLRRTEAATLRGRTQPIELWAAQSTDVKRQVPDCR